MKRNLFFNQATAIGKRLAMVLTMLLIVGIGQAWAETKTYSYTFSAKQFSANGSKTLNSVSWTLAGDGNYWGYDGTKGQQFGSGSAPYKTLTLSTSGISGTITKIIINTSGASSVNASFTVSVGGTQYGNSTKLTTSATAYTFTGSNSGEIKFSYTQTSSKALYIKSISVTYETAAATVPVTEVSLNKSTLTLTEGDSETLTATMSPDNATNKTVTWSTNKSSVATVSNGKVTAVAAGNATITVTTEDGGKTATCSVTVNPKPKYTVTLDAGSGTCAESVTEPNAGDGVTLPTPTLSSACQSEGWSFAGWAIASVDTETETEPTLIAAGAYSPTSDITLYAVYKRTEESAGGGSTEEKVIFSNQGYTNQQEVSSYDGTNFSVAFDKGSNSNTPKYYTSGTAIRIYGGGYFTVSSNATITKIVLGFGSSDGSNAITTNVDTYSNGTWTGSANSVKFTIGGSSGNRRIASLTVTTFGGGSTTYYHSTPECTTQTSR